MENITITETNHTPAVTFDTNGKLSLEGRAFPEDAAVFFDPLIDFVMQLKTPYVTVDINLEYINTAASKKIFNLLKELENNQLVASATINWHYEEGDEDSVETAEIFEESLPDLVFTYNELADMSL